MIEGDCVRRTILPVVLPALKRVSHSSVVTLDELIDEVMNLEVEMQVQLE